MTKLRERDKSHTQMAQSIRVNYTWAKNRAMESSSRSSKVTLGSGYPTINKVMESIRTSLLAEDFRGSFIMTNPMENVLRLHITTVTKETGIRVKKRAVVCKCLTGGDLLNRALKKTLITFNHRAKRKTNNRNSLPRN
jgi:hypothetical protein